ncbi:phage tail protein [Nocardia transvalensis]|uniref:Gp37-like protein n=1 Tax=Nocardia transvalensis TaxID=37333 RepID=UPI0018933083|nr:phage tail protein [Nocardia transvalensis]MBF6332369.1 phage tail protein [Nocardia transvalensis]
MTAPAPTLTTDQAVIDRVERIYTDAITARTARKQARTARPLIRLWDGDWNLRGICTAEYSAQFTWLLNETGTGTLELPADHYLARWVMDPASRTTENVHVTADHMGARWSGRMRTATLRKTSDGHTSVVVTFAHDYEELKWIHAIPNPFLPPNLIQFPRTFLLAAPSRWGLKLTLFLNLLRKEANLWALPDDPLDARQWVNLDQSTWSMVVAPSDFVSDTSLWTVISSRWKVWHDLAKDVLDDAQLMVTCRRWLDGDPPPWPGARLRHGCLVVDVVDKSGWFTETSGGGTVWDGLRRTAFRIADDFIEGTLTDVPNPGDAAEYLQRNWMGTSPQQPWVVYRDGEITGIQSSEFTLHPATAVQINCGGKSAYGINEAMSAMVQMAGDALAAVPGLVPVGGALEVALRPIFSDTVGAWMSFKSPWRAQRLGWSHYYEYFQSGADRAYTLSALLALRAGMWATRSYVSYKLTIADGAPYFVGDNGHGHFFLGDRIGATIAGAPPGRVYVDQVNELSLSWKRGLAPAWEVSIGTDHSSEDPVARALRYIQNIFSDLHDLGVFG